MCGTVVPTSNCCITRGTRARVIQSLSLNLDNGGHLTHGSSVNFSGKFFDVHFYNVDDNGFIDMEKT